MQNFVTQKAIHIYFQGNIWGNLRETRGGVGKSECWSTLVDKSFYGAHQKNNLNEDKPIMFSGKM